MSSTCDEPALGEPWSLTSRDVAEYLGITLDGLYEIEPEALPYMQPRGKRGERRYRPSDVRAYARDRAHGLAREGAST